LSLLTAFIYLASHYPLEAHLSRAVG
jgi:hypothetical protein